MRPIPKLKYSSLIVKMFLPPLNGQLGNCEQYSYLSGNQTSDYSGYPPNYCTPVCNEGYVLRGTSQCFDRTFDRKLCFLKANSMNP